MARHERQPNKADSQASNVRKPRTFSSTATVGTSKSNNSVNATNRNEKLRTKAPGTSYRTAPEDSFQIAISQGVQDGDTWVHNHVKNLIRRSIIVAVIVVAVCIVVFGVMGDSTFFHSGMTGAAEIIYNNGRMIPCVLDNRITGMTGHQDNPGTGYTLQGDPTALLSVEKILTALGFAPVLTVDPQDLKAMKAAVDQAVAALDAGQQPAIVTRRPCLLIKRDKFRKGMCRVNADKCRSCRSCLKVGCPAISLENGKAVIDRTQCVGCTVCAQVCPFDAIEKEEK